MRFVPSRRSVVLRFVLGRKVFVERFILGRHWMKIKIKKFYHVFCDPFYILDVFPRLQYPCKKIVGIAGALVSRLFYPQAERLRVQAELSYHIIPPSTKSTTIILVSKEKDSDNTDPQRTSGYQLFNYPIDHHHSRIWLRPSIAKKAKILPNFTTFSGAATIHF